jgi:hypothetical protein
VSLAHLVGKVDVQHSQLGSNHHRRRFGSYIISEKEINVGASPTAFLLKKEGNFFQFGNYNTKMP